MKPLSDCKLYAFVDTAYLHGRAPALLARQLCDGGADLIQLRAKQWSPAEIRAMAAEILPVTKSAGAGLVINDHLSIAREVGADFCHLGQEDFFGAGYSRVEQLTGAEPGCIPGSARRQPAPLIGLSTHAPAQAAQAIAAGAQYIAIGPVFATGTKPGVAPVTLDYVRWAAAHVAIPWFAIGGIHFGNLEAVLEAGARKICAVSAILNAPDVAAACRELRRKLDRAL